MKSRALKRILALILCLTILLPAVPVQAAVTEERLHESGNFYYTIDTDAGEVTITKGIFVGMCADKDSVSIEIPDTIEGYPVTAIASYAFWGWWELTEVHFPASLRTIEQVAFKDTCVLVVDLFGSHQQGSLQVL